MTQQFHSGYISEENKNTNSKRHLHTNVHRSAIYNIKGVEACQVPINRGADKKMWYIQWNIAQP